MTKLVGASSPLIIVTFFPKQNDIHPRKWIADVINANLSGDEELVEWETEEVSNDFELLSSINDIPN